MSVRVKNSFLVFIFCSSFSFFAQDSICYRNTSFHLSAGHFFLLGSRFQQTNNFFPTASFSLKSFKTDSSYHPQSHLHFMLTMGAAGSRFLLTDETFFVNIPDKTPMPVFSKRFWGGFGVSYRKSISKKLILDVDAAPVIQIIVDKSEESRLDTSGWESRGFYDIYQGLLGYVNLKLEYKTGKAISFYGSLSASVPIINRFGNHGDDPYHNQFKGQVFVGLGMTYFYKTKHLTEPNEKSKAKQ